MTFDPMKERDEALRRLVEQNLPRELQRSADELREELIQIPWPTEPGVQGLSDVLDPEAFRDRVCPHADNVKKMIQEGKEAVEIGSYLLPFIIDPVIWPTIAGGIIAVKIVAYILKKGIDLYCGGWSSPSVILPSS